MASCRLQQSFEEGLGVADRHGHDLADGLAGDGGGAGELVEARAVAGGTGALALIRLVFRPRLVVLGLVEALLEDGEDALEGAVDGAPREHEVFLEAVHEAVAELRRELLVWRVEGDAVLLRDLLEERVVIHDRVVSGAAPGVDAFAQGQRLVGHDQVFVEVEETSEPAAGRAGAEGGVEGEGARLQLVEGNAAVRAGVQLGESERTGNGDRGMGNGRIEDLHL